MSEILSLQEARDRRCDKRDGMALYHEMRRPQLEPIEGNGFPFKLYSAVEEDERVLTAALDRAANAGFLRIKIAAGAVVSFGLVVALIRHVAG